jgi:hypothetical protein
VKFFKLCTCTLSIISSLFFLWLFQLSAPLTHAQEEPEFDTEVIPPPETDTSPFPWEQPTETPPPDGEFTEFNYCDDYPDECANQGNENFLLDNKPDSNPFLGEPDHTYGDPETGLGSPFFGRQFTPVDPDTADATGYIDLSSYFNFGGLAALPESLAFNPDDPDMEAKAEEAVAAGLAPVVANSNGFSSKTQNQPLQDQAEANRALQDIQRIAANSPNSNFVPLYYNGEIVLQPKEQFCQQNQDLCNGPTSSLIDLSNRTRELLGTLNTKLHDAGYDGPRVLCNQLGGAFCDHWEEAEQAQCRVGLPGNNPQANQQREECGNPDICPAGETLCSAFTDFLNSAYRDRLHTTPECIQDHTLPYCAILATTLAQGEAGILAGAALSFANIAAGEASALDIINLALATRGLPKIAVTTEAEAAVSSALNNSRGQILPITTVREIATNSESRAAGSSNVRMIVANESGPVRNIEISVPDSRVIRFDRLIFQEGTDTLTPAAQAQFGSIDRGSGHFKVSVESKDGVVTSFFYNATGEDSLWNAQQVEFYMRNQQELRGVAPVTNVVTDSSGVIRATQSQNAGVPLSQYAGRLQQEAIDEIVALQRGNIQRTGMPHGDIIAETPFQAGGSYRLSEGNILVRDYTDGAGIQRQQITLIDYYGTGGQIRTNGIGSFNHSTETYTRYLQNEADWLKLGLEQWAPGLYR